MLRTVAIKVVSITFSLSLLIQLSRSVKLVLFAGSSREKLNLGEVFSRLLYDNHLKLSIVRSVRIFNSIILPLWLYSVCPVSPR